VIQLDRRAELALNSLVAASLLDLICKSIFVGYVQLFDGYILASDK
jgi:hypothetical protein